MSKRVLYLLFFFLFGLPFVHAQDAVVYGLFFFSPTCPHCHEVIDNHWDGIQAQFGQQLQVVFVDITTPEGADLMRAAANSMNLESMAVPQLIIGNTVMVGSVDIPRDTPFVVQRGIEAGGVPYPNIPNIENWFAQAGMQSPVMASGLGFNLDPANSLAVIVLIFMLGSLALVIWGAWQALVQNQITLLQRINGELGWGLLALTLLIGFGLVLSLLFGSSEPMVSLLAAILAVIFIVGMFLLGKNGKLNEIPQWFVPLLLIVGIITAGYLTLIEMSLSEAVCGAFGNCNVVQQSDYAQIAGVPIGFIGLIVYAVMLLLVLGRKFLGQMADTLLFVLTLGGIAFSIYLTYLEPFVIGATCVWCLTSAIVMLALLWMIVPRSFALFINQDIPKQKVLAR